MADLHILYTALRKFITFLAVTFSEPAEKLFPQPSHAIVGAGGVGDTDGYTAITDVRRIDFDDEAAIKAEIEQFRVSYANDEIEHAIVFSPDGHMYRLQGTSSNVNIELLDPVTLRGSRIIHNHPISWSDSFSEDDFAKFFEFEILQEEVVFGRHHNIMRYSGVPIVPNEARALYRDARTAVWQNALRIETPVELEQLEIMRQLSRTMKGLIFHEYSRI